MIFKNKKYTRTEWFEGLLWAEHQLRFYKSENNLFVEDEDGMEEYRILWRDRPHETPWIIKTVSREFGAGILDYINYFNERLK